MIEASGLAKKYKKTYAVNDLSFKVEPGKVTGFLGPNGAGKSTTMRLMLGLDRGKGKTLYDGKRLHQYARPSQMIGILLEAKAFHPTRSARQHLRILANAGGIPLSRVEEVLDEVGLTSVAKKKPGKFSLGMSQRLGIAAALLGKPKYLMLDEPSNGLDPEGIAWLRDFLKNYADQGNGVLVSSHLLSEIDQMVDNVVVIGKGTLIADTSIAELLAKNAHNGVLIRSPKLAQLERLLKTKKVTTNMTNNILIAHGIGSDQVGKLAFDNQVPLYELSPQKASLEEVFLELTAGAGEYVSHQETKK